MECKTIHEKLSAYIEGLTSPEEKVLIEEHLKSCIGCRTDLADLRKTLEHVKNLEEIEPPPWLTQKVMARVRAETQPKKSLFQKLFYPLHVKLPVGAVATVAIALTTLYIFRTMEPEVKLAKAPSEEAVPKLLSKDVTPPSPPLAKGGEGGFEEGKVPAKPSEELKKVLPSSPLTPPEPVKQAELSQEQRTLAPAKKLERVPATGTIAKDEARQEARAAVPKAKLSYMEKKEEEALILTVFVKDPETAVKEIEKTVKELEGKAIHTESAEGKEIVSAILKANSLHKLSEKLKVIGEVKEKVSDEKGQEGDVMLRIEITKSP